MTVSADDGRSWTSPVGCTWVLPCHDSPLFGGYVSQIAAVSAVDILSFCRIDPAGSGAYPSAFMRAFMRANMTA